MLIDRITDARLVGPTPTDGRAAERRHDIGRRHDVVLGGGTVLAVRPTGAAQPGEAVGPGGVEPGDAVRPAGARRPAGTTLPVQGRVVAPAFVDAHVHLDKAYLSAAVAAAPAGTPYAVAGRSPEPSGPRLDAAIAEVGRLRETVPIERIHAGAALAIDTLVRHGTVAARVHVEIDPVAGLDLVTFHQALTASVADRCEVQLVAFPQRGLERPGTRELMAAAMAEGLDVVGGCPYVDQDPIAHLDAVFALAERHGRPVDLHLDFHDEPGRSLIEAVAERTRAHGMAGRVTIGHVTTLAAMAPTAQASALDLLADAGIALVVLPATDLYLGGHGEPGTRSLAPVDRAIQAGVRVAIANNNLANPFAPFGNGNLLQAAWLAGITRRMADDDQPGGLLAAVTTTPAAILGLPEHGPQPGRAAHLAVLDTADPASVPLGAPAVLATLRAGRLVHRVTVPEPVGGAGP
ncbi:amidohydrolase family protein [Frankia sp. CNm7]|uniref:Amidohydrolase family protein n=1 Tax=Frankia nepalensis TaxID=1836974 RepID=A0A937ULR9_9ACTN|nr:amidohydrolase family protein [Frankia nepalensis]MBL7495808.1 amidohydrolase family protein [Frankia nepalensis]MBL7513258.1 amidohydrolase family protein [Frankia nepalensis]MBL7519489.1 amidohydrolase family protein [Frankia nepalensis]MBL7628139.1 amidohydrolase family protein [Frankia nepalensis]